VEASPINPSDLGVLVPGAEMATATVTGTPERPIVTASLGERALAGLSARVDKPLPAGNEGAGTVVAAGSSPAAQALLGKTVGIAGGAMYTQYRAIDASACLVLPDGSAAKDGASSFVNPLTALGMLETMRREGHSGLVHTAAASNLGQMLVKLCAKDGVPLVNIVRKPDQEELLRSLGAVHVLNSASPSFEADLVAALKATSATLAFDATGGGTLVSQILNGMEQAAARLRWSIHAMGRLSTSRSTPTADSTPVRQRSPETSAWRGVLEGGCSPIFCRARTPRRLVGSGPG
jgi:NADPH:quinone reductase-like Zn-dependent oxidoreductase